MSAKVKLIVQPQHPWTKKCGEPHMPLTMALPFFKSGSGMLWHRVRSGLIHTRDGKYSHTSISYWCGNTGFLGESRKKCGTLSGDPGPDAVHCALCEGKVTGMRLDGSNKILGRTVLYRPRV